MAMLGSSFRRLCLWSNIPHITTSLPVTCKWSMLGSAWVHSSPVLNSVPMKKKKRVDPALIKLRDERKARRIQKEIKRLKKMEKQFKPIDETEVSPKLMEEKLVRTRKIEPLTKEIMDERKILKEEWAKYKLAEFNEEMTFMSQLIKSQNKALHQLRKESEELYQHAIKLDENFLPFNFTGPVRTPPITNFEAADGEFVDITRRWDEKPASTASSVLGRLRKAKKTNK